MLRVDADHFSKPDYGQLTFFDHAAEVADTHPGSFRGFLDRQQVFTGSAVNFLRSIAFRHRSCGAVSSPERTAIRFNGHGSPPFGTPADRGRRGVQAVAPIR